MGSAHGVGASRQRPRAALVLALFSVDLLAWHIPALYNATLQIDAVHNLEHTLFLATGLLYWDLVVHAEAAPGRLTLGARAAFLLGGMVVSWVLAIVIGYASHPSTRIRRPHTDRACCRTSRSPPV